MQNAGIPTKYNVPWAYAAGAAYTRVVPIASQTAITPGAASFTDGFVPLNATPVSAGGVPPFMQDFNGILHSTTSWLQWFQAGGPTVYDASFATQIGGYPRGAVLQSSALNGTFWISTADNNTSNPDTGGVGWTSEYAQPHQWTASQSFSGGLSSVAWDSANGMNIRAVSLNYSFGIRNDNTSSYLCLTNSSTTPVTAIVNTLQPFAVMNATGAVTIDGTAAGTKFGGNITANGAINAANGPITANNGRLRASLGARGSGDLQAATILNDYSQSMTGNGYTLLPNGLIIQWGTTGISATGTGLVSVNIPIPLVFPTNFLWCGANFDGNTPPSSGSAAALVVNNGYIQITIYAVAAGVYGVAFIAIGN